MSILKSMKETAAEAVKLPAQERIDDLREMANTFRTNDSAKLHECLDAIESLQALNRGLTDLSVAITKENAELRKDKARLDWAESHNVKISKRDCPPWNVDISASGSHIRAAIDAAMKDKQ